MKKDKEDTIRICFETYGCSANFSNTEIMIGYIFKDKSDDKFKLVKDIKEADVVVINTCIVKSPTESRMWKRLKYFSSLNKKIIVAGCMPEVYSKKILELYPHFILLGARSTSRIKEAINSAIRGKEFVGIGKRKEIKASAPKLRKNKIINIIQISDGCLGNCTYCSVKFAKGGLFSYPIESIVNDVKNGLKQHCKEVWLTSQDNSAYGIDFSEYSKLPFLLNKISEINGKFFVRVGMMNPNHMIPLLNEFVDSFTQKNIFKFVHIPVQSGNDRILSVMKRRYRADDFKDIVKAFREKIPNITISTDVICGFPTETEDEFLDTINLIKKIKPDVLNISKFWSRPYTLSSKMKQLDGREIKRRSKLMTETFDKISLANNKKWLGWEGEVLIDEYNEKNKSFVGRNYAYKPVVIKQSNRDNSNIKNIDNIKIGDFVRVKIRETTTHDLRAEILTE